MPYYLFILSIKGESIRMNTEQSLLFCLFELEKSILKQCLKKADY